MWRPLRPTRLCHEHASVGIVLPTRLPGIRGQKGGTGAVHRTRRASRLLRGGDLRGGQHPLCPRAPTGPVALERFAQRLGPNDEVALECTGNALAIARIIEPHVAKPVIAHAKAVRAIVAKVKNDRIDARILAMLLASGFLPGVWTPDERTRLLRRLVTRRAQLLKQRTLGQEPGPRDASVHPGGQTSGHRPVRQARSSLAGDHRAAGDGRETVDGALSQIEFLDTGETQRTSSIIGAQPPQIRVIRV